MFDCAGRYGGTSLNDQLLKGPDLLGNLVGVLTRLRIEKVAVVGDIKQMFHQVGVDPKDSQYLRFLWWPRGNLALEPQTY